MSISDADVVRIYEQNQNMDVMLFGNWPVYQTLSHARSMSICSVILSLVMCEFMNTLETPVLMFHVQQYAILMSKTQRTNTVHTKC